MSMTASPQLEASPKSDQRGTSKPGPPASQTGGASLVSLNSAIFKDVNVTLKARLGELTLTVAELLALKSGSVVKLDAGLNDLVELRLNQTVVARGELVAVGDHFGLRIVEIAPSQ
jgi:flagellar motor switch protein FliN/FliY